MVYRTLDEAWMDLPTYRAAEVWARRSLGIGTGRRCLVIGSPMREVRALVNQRWQVTYLDLRVPSPTIDPSVEIQLGDACQQPFEDATFDGISSTCVLCHVGTGRYGDDLRSDAPMAMLRECARVLKPGGTLVMMVGPVGVQSEVQDKHRVTTIHEVQHWCQSAGFQEQAQGHTKGDTDEWAGDTDEPNGYLCVTWVKAC